MIAEKGTPEYYQMLREDRWEEEYHERRHKEEI